MDGEPIDPSTTAHSFWWGAFRNPLGLRRRGSEGFDMSLQAKVEVRLDVAEIIRWIVIGCYLLT